MFGNRGTGLGPGCQAWAGARGGWVPEAVPAQVGRLGCSGPLCVGFPPPFFSSQPILSQVTCGCVCNKPLSWLLKGLFSGPGMAVTEMPVENWAHPSLSSTSGPETQSGAPGAKGTVPSSRVKRHDLRAISTALTPVCPFSGS